MLKIAILLAVIFIPHTFSYTTQWRLQNRSEYLTDEGTDYQARTFYWGKLFGDRRKADNAHIESKIKYEKTPVNPKFTVNKYVNLLEVLIPKKLPSLNNSLASFDFKSLVRSKRQISASGQMINMGVDFLIRMVQPFLGTRGLVLSALFRPILLFLGNIIFTGGVSLVKNLMSQEQLKDGSGGQEPSYAAYPVYIPGYGSYILLSNNGTLELLSNSSSMSDSMDDKKDSKDNSEEDKKEVTTSVSEKSKGENKIITPDKNKDSSEEITEEEDDIKDKDKDKIKDKDKDSDKNKDGDKKMDKDDSEEDKEKEKIKEMNTKDSSSNKTQSVYLGQTHLIPIANKPNVFQSTEDLKDADWGDATDETIRECIKQILGSRMEVKNIKKKILINILHRLEYAIANLVR